MQTACDEVLIEGMRPGLKQAIDNLLARGVNRDGIKAFVRQAVARAVRNDADQQRGELTQAAVDAYLERQR